MLNQGRNPMEMKAAKILQRIHLKLKQLLQKEAVAAPVKRVQAMEEATILPLCQRK